jgi:hypothetical protein
VRLKVSSVKCHAGDQSCHSCLHKARRLALRPARPRSVLKYHWYQILFSASGGGGPGSGEYVLYGVAADEDRCSYAIRMKRCGDACSATAPVITGYGKTGKLQGVGEIDEVLADCGLFGLARGGRVAEAGGSEAAQVWHEDSVAGFRQRRHDFVIGVDVVGKAVQEDDREALGIATLFAGDVQDWRLHRFRRGAGIRRYCCYECGLEETSSAVQHTATL